MSAEFPSNLRSFLLATIVILVYNGHSAVKISKFLVPRFKIRGEDVLLICEFDLEGDILYSTKWYKEDDEFYRFVPRDRPRQLTFFVPGVNVSVTRSGESYVTLKSVDVNTSGQFKCEVSAEAPSFQTAIEVGTLLVIDLPDGPPVISGGYVSSHINELIKVNCTSYRSKPAVELHWSINGEPAERKFLRIYPNVVEYDGTETTTLGMEFRAKKKHFNNGEMKLKCTARIPDVYWKSREERYVKIEKFHNAKLAEVKGSSVSISLSVIAMIPTYLHILSSIEIRALS